MTNDEQQQPADDGQWAALQREYPTWRLTDHYHASVSGPGVTIYMAARGDVCVSSYTIPGLRAHLAQLRPPKLSVVRDPAGLQRCASCGNAFEYDRGPDGLCAICGQPFDEPAR